MTEPRTIPPMEADERATLTAFLDWQRATLAVKCEGLTDDQLRERAVPPSSLSLLGIVRHMAEVEKNWFRPVLGGEPMATIFAPGMDWEVAFSDVLTADVAEQSASGKPNAITPEAGDRRPVAGRPGVPAQRPRVPALGADSHDRGVRPPQRARRPAPGAAGRFDGGVISRTGLVSRPRHTSPLLRIGTPRGPPAVHRQHHPGDEAGLVGEQVRHRGEVDNEEQHALMLLSIGISYRLLNKPDEALRNYQESIAVNEKIGQKRGVAAALNEIAAVQWTSGHPELALVSYNKALNLLREIGMKDEVANTLTNMGSAYSDLGKFDQALDVYKQALQIQRETGDQTYESRCLDNIAGVYLSMGDTNNAFTYWQQALQLRGELAVPGDIADTLLGLSEAYTQRANTIKP